MNKKFNSFLLLTLFLMAFMSTANAQMGDQERARIELERTDQVLERAREVVYSSGSPMAKAAFEEAKRLRDASWDSFRGHKYGQAMEQTKLARQLAERAITAGRSAEENRDMVQRKLEHAKGLLERIRENAPEDIPNQFKAIFQRAKDNLQRANEFYRTGQYRAALKLCNQVENAARKIIEKTQTHKQIQNRFQHRYEQVGEMIENNKPIIADCESEKAQTMFQQAIRAYEKSGELKGQKNFEGATKLLQNAFQLMNKAVKECQGGAEFSERLERIKNVYTALVEKVDPSDDRGQLLLKQIREQIALAQQAEERNNLDAANAALRAAGMKIKQLRRYLEGEL